MISYSSAKQLNKNMNSVGEINKRNGGVYKAERVVQKSVPGEL